MPKKKLKIKKRGVSISIDIDIPIEKILDQSTVDALGRKITSDSIKFMESGVSPVNGKRFAQYKDPNKYPKNIKKKYPNKSKTPVNLKLSGKLYESFGWRKISDTIFNFGLLNADAKVLTYAAVHNKDDTGRSDIPERKFLPTKRGEEFNRSIMLEIKRIIVNRISKLF